jgi:hypothetical protein
MARLTATCVLPYRVLVGNPIGVKSRLVLLRSHARTGRIMRIAKIVSAVAVFACACPGFAQQQAFQWHRGTEETVRLDPANYHGGKSYGPQGGTIHVEIEAQQPVSIFMTSAREWNRAMQSPELLGNIRTICLREHVMKVVYTCDLPQEPMQLIVRLG